MDNEGKSRCIEFVRELLERRDGLLHVDIPCQNAVLKLIQIACNVYYNTNIIFNNSKQIRGM